MHWALFALFSALFTSFFDVLNKAVLRKDKLYFAGRIQILLTAILYLPLLIAFGRLNLPIRFWQIVLFVVPFEFLSYFLYLRALQVSPLSLTVPFLAFTPIVTTLFSYLILKELPTLNGFIGILLIVLGGYTINIKSAPEGFWGPIKATMKEKGSVYMLGAAFIFGLTAVLAKSAIRLSSPLIYMPIQYISFAIFALLYIYFFVPKGEKERQGRTDLFKYILLAMAMVASALFFSYGITLANVAYMISIKRFSLVLGVVWGRFIFKESHVRERLAAAVLMFLGVLLILLD